MEINLIALTGNSRAGKDETAKILRTDFGFEQRAQADGIREILLGIDPLLHTDDRKIITMVELFESCDGDWDRVKAASRESTELMIKIGQSCRNVLGESVWLDRVLPSGNFSGKIVVSDVRQLNEYHAIKARGGLIWKVSRPSAEKRGMDGLLDGLDFDFHIENRGSLKDLRGLVQAGMQSAKERGKYGKD